MFIAHINAWSRQEEKHGSSLLLVEPIAAETPGITVQGLFAEFYLDCNMFDHARIGYQRVWDMATSDEGPWPFIRSRAGIGLAAVARFRGETQTAVNLARDNVQHWNKNGPQSLLNESRYVLATLLVTSPLDADTSREAEDILQTLLRDPSLSAAARHVYMAELACLLAQDHQLQAEGAAALATVLRGVVPPRRWTLSLWICVCLDFGDLHTREALARVRHDPGSAGAAVPGRERSPARTTAEP